MSRRLAVALAALLLLLPAASAAAAPPVRASFNDIEKRTMCIECNVPLNIANSAQADATRVEIRHLIGEGLTKKQVLNQLVKDYGPNILAAPKAKGFNLLAYLIPVAAVLALVALGLYLPPRWKRNRDEEPPPPDAPVLGRRDARRLDEELARYGV